MRLGHYFGLGTVAAVGLVAGCSSGGDGSQTGTLSVSLMDAPVDNVTEVHVQITALWIKPQGNGPAVELPMTASPVTVDLLELDDQNAAVLIDSATVDAGVYNWLEMEVNAELDGTMDSYVMTKEGGMFELQVPSGRVRLVSGFEVEPNQAVLMLFDWETHKGLVNPPGQLDPSGQPGYVLKPAFRMLDVTELGVLSGVVALGTIQDSSCTADDADFEIGNRVYIFAGGDTPDDIDGTSDPVAVAPVEHNGSEYAYRTVLMPGNYTVAFTCQAANDNPATDETGGADELVFVGEASVTISTTAEETLDF